MEKLKSLKLYLKSEGIPYEAEYNFCRDVVGHGKGIRTRLKEAGLKDWRFDLAIPSKMIAVEYEGINSAKSRHTSITGYTGDCDKYNAAILQGWRVLRYTPLNEGQAVRDVEKLIKYLQKFQLKKECSTYTRCCV